MPDLTDQDRLPGEVEAIEAGDFFHPSPPKTSGASLLPQELQSALSACADALRGIRTQAFKAMLVSEAPSARAMQEVRKAGSKNEGIEPKGTHGNLIAELEQIATKLAETIQDAHERSEYQVAKFTIKPPDSFEGFTSWAKLIHERHQAGTSKRQLMREYHCGLPLIDKALAVHARKLATAA